MPNGSGKGTEPLYFPSAFSFTTISFFFKLLPFFSSVTFSLGYGPRTWENVLEKGDEFLGASSVHDEISNGAVFTLTAGITGGKSGKSSLSDNIFENRNNGTDSSPHSSESVGKSEKNHLNEGVCITMKPYKCMKEYTLCRVYHAESFSKEKGKVKERLKKTVQTSITSITTF